MTLGLGRSTPLSKGQGSDTGPGRQGLTSRDKQPGAPFPVLQACRAGRPASGLGLLSPSTAAAARLRERRGGPGGPAGPLRGPSYTSCSCGALKGFARARCATDENIFLGEEEKTGVSAMAKSRSMSPAPRTQQGHSSRLRALEEVTAPSQGRPCPTRPTAKAAAP